jgi:hypothetical protein
MSLGPALLSQVRIVNIVTCYRLNCSRLFEPWYGVRFSTPIHTGPGAQSTFCKMVTRSSPGVQWIGHALTRKQRKPESATLNRRQGYPILCSSPWKKTVNRMFPNYLSTLNVLFCGYIILCTLLETVTYTILKLSLYVLLT